MRFEAHWEISILVGTFSATMVVEVTDWASPVFCLTGAQGLAHFKIRAEAINRCTKPSHLGTLYALGTLLPTPYPEVRALQSNKPSANSQLLRCL